MAKQQQPSDIPKKQKVQKDGKVNPRNFRPKGAPSAANAGNPAQLKGGKRERIESKLASSSAKKVADGQSVRGLGAVVVRNEFYRDGYRNMLRVVVAESLIILLLVCVMFYVVHIHQPENRYFATTEDGRLVPMVAMNQANLSKPALMSWVAQAVTEVMTFSFLDYRRRLQEASRHFTKEGWSSFTRALDQSGILESVQVNRQIMTTIPAGAPVLQEEGLDATGRYFWKVELPISVTYQAGSRSRSDKIVVTLIIVRVPRLESPYGIGIEQWVARYGG